MCPTLLQIWYHLTLDDDLGQSCVDVLLDLSETHVVQRVVEVKQESQENPGQQRVPRHLIQVVNEGLDHHWVDFLVPELCVLRQGPRLLCYVLTMQVDTAHMVRQILHDEFRLGTGLIALHNKIRGVEFLQ